MSAVVEQARHVEAPASAATDRPEELAAVVVQLVRLAGGRVRSSAFEPAALLLVREGVLDGSGVTFGCDYDLNIRSRELRRGYVRAVDSGDLMTSIDEIWLSRDQTEMADQLEADSERAALAREVFALPRAELVRRARHLLLAE